jgi:hypothetical protein
MQLFRVVFLCFQGQTIIFKFFQKDPSVRTEKLHNIKLRKYKKDYKKIIMN